jgi:hypothetical protein
MRRKRREGKGSEEERRGEKRSEEKKRKVKKSKQRQRKYQPGNQKGAKAKRKKSNFTSLAGNRTRHPLPPHPHLQAYAHSSS